MMIIHKGDIVTIETKKFVDFPGGRWCDHFVPCRKLLVAKEVPSNNGNFKAIDVHSNLFWLNTKDVIEVRKGSSQKSMLLS
jgi:hypothetical protein